MNVKSTQEYTTQMHAAKQGIITEAMKIVAQKEHMDPEVIRERVAKGTIAIPANRNHLSLNPEGVGEGLRTKMNVNLGISKDCNDPQMELEKVRVALDMGVEAIMDLSNYGKTEAFRKELIDISGAMIGTVPVYDVFGFYEKELKDVKPEDFLGMIRKHGQDGVDFVTIHAGMNKAAAETFLKNPRMMNLVSRGGSLMFAWMRLTGHENPYYEYFDDLLDICAEFDITLSLGDACRPGGLADSTDASQIHELIMLGELTRRAWEKNVQVIIEGPGHMSMDEIEANVLLEKNFVMERPSMYLDLW